MVLLGRPKNGDIVRAQLRIKESKEFKVSQAILSWRFAIIYAVRISNNFTFYDCAIKFKSWNPFHLTYSWILFSFPFPKCEMNWKQQQQLNNLPLEKRNKICACKDPLPIRNIDLKFIEHTNFLLKTNCKHHRLVLKKKKNKFSLAHVEGKRRLEWTFRSHFIVLLYLLILRINKV